MGRGLPAIEAVTGRLARRVKAKLRPRPSACYVHPKAVGIVRDNGDHDAYLDVAEDSSPNYLRWIADMSARISETASSRSERAWSLSPSNTRTGETCW